VAASCADTTSVQALVISAAFTGLRWGDLGLCACEMLSLTPEWCTLCESSLNCRTADGFRTVALPSVLVAVVREHLTEFPPSDPKDLIFKGPRGAALRRNNFHRSARWPECVAEAGLPEGFRFPRSAPHRQHVGGLVGASTRELMHRMGHASMRAALIYQHATSKRDQETAAAIDARIGTR
jgi:integrase